MKVTFVFSIDMTQKQMHLFYALSNKFGCLDKKIAELMSAMRNQLANYMTL
jgi:hypothetical protein